MAKKKATSKTSKKEAKLPIKLKGKKEKKQPEKRKLKLPWPLNKIVKYLSDSRKELKKVKWPKRKEAWKLTFAVILFTLVFMIIIVIADQILSRLVERVLL